MAHQRGYSRRRDDLSSHIDECSKCRQKTLHVSDDAGECLSCGFYYAVDAEGSVAEGNRKPKVIPWGSGTAVTIEAEGAVLKLNFDSMAEAQQFIDGYANAVYVQGAHTKGKPGS